MSLKTNFRIIIFLYLVAILFFVILRSITIRHFKVLIELYRELGDFKSAVYAREDYVYQRIFEAHFAGDSLNVKEALEVKDLFKNAFLKNIILKNENLAVYYKALDSLYGNIQVKLDKLNSLPERQKLLRNGLVKSILRDLKQIDKISFRIQVDLERFLMKWKSKFIFYNLIFFSALVIILLILTLLAFYSTRVLNQSVDTFYAASREFENLNFVAKFEVDNNTEFAAIASRLNRAKDIVRNKIAQNIKFVHQVLHVASVITKSTKVVYLSAVREAKSAEKLYSLIEEIDSMLSENIELVHNSTEITKQFSQAVDVIKSNISEIADFIEQMLTSLTEISKVANKIDFLAINSAIEAVKAGENGKGFKVIAKEIRILANNTKDLADKIIVMSKIGVVQVENTIKQALSSFQHVDNLIHFTNTISNSFEQQVQMLEELKQNISLLSESSQEHVNLAQYLTNTAKYLRNKSLTLKEILKDFKI